MKYFRSFLQRLKGVREEQIMSSLALSEMPLSDGLRVATSIGVAQQRKVDILESLQTSKMAPADGHGYCCCGCTSAVPLRLCGLRSCIAPHLLLYSLMLPPDAHRRHNDSGSDGESGSESGSKLKLRQAPKDRASAAAASRDSSSRTPFHSSLHSKATMADRQKHQNELDRGRSDVTSDILFSLRQAWEN